MSGPFHLSVQPGRRSDFDGAFLHLSAFAAKEWADTAIMWYGYELGPESEYVQQMKDVVKSPQSQRAWGTRGSQMVGGPLKKT